MEQLAWATTRPSVFWVLDTADTMHIFDLLESQGKPTSSVPLRPSKGAADAPEGEEFGEPLPMRFALDVAPPVSNRKARRMMAATYKRAGRLEGVEVHVLNERVAARNEGEEAQLRHLLDGL